MLPLNEPKAEAFLKIRSGEMPTRNGKRWTGGFRSLSLFPVLLGLQMKVMAVGHGAPPMPAVFDQGTVAHLLQDIDKPYNCSVLEVGYFGHRTSHPLAYKDGYRLVLQALAKEEVGSQRWFLLEQLRGFAGTSVYEVSPAESYLAYNAIFDHANMASTSLAEYSLIQSISEYVETCGSRFHDLGVQTDPDTQKTLANAWRAWVLTNVRKDIDRRRFRVSDPKWVQAIQATKAEATMLPVIESTLQDPATPRSYIVLVTAAQVYADGDVARSIEFFKQAKSLLPRQDLSQVDWFYTTLVDWLVKAGKVQDAVEAQRERIALLGRGRSELLLLISRSEKPASYEEVLTDMAVPKANPWEINDVAETLLGLFDLDKKTFANAPSQVELLLSKRLQSTLNPNRVQELRSRLLLSQALLVQKRPREALIALEQAKTTMVRPNDIEEKDYCERILRAKQFLAKIDTKG